MKFTEIVDGFTRAFIGALIITLIWKTYGLTVVTVTLLIWVLMVVLWLFLASIHR